VPIRGDGIVTESKQNSAAKAAALGFTALSLCALVVTEAHANSVVYRCLDAHLTVVYTDEPCKEGAPVEIRPGEADPAALARLDRIRDALDQSALQRTTAAPSSIVPVPAYGEASAGPEDMYDDGGYYTYPIAGYGTNRRHRLRNRVEHHDHVKGSATKPFPGMRP
jgi:Domain of unknown function (DUF4124)